VWRTLHPFLFPKKDFEQKFVLGDTSSRLTEFPNGLGFQSPHHSQLSPFSLPLKCHGCKWHSLLVPLKKEKGIRITPYHTKMQILKCSFLSSVPFGST
jgi:hypothetical protein